jgi:hypothetical protein
MLIDKPTGIANASKLGEDGSKNSPSDAGHNYQDDRQVLQLANLLGHTVANGRCGILGLGLQVTRYTQRPVGRR